jgi:hypothetical protein
MITLNSVSGANVKSEASVLLMKKQDDQQKSVVGKILSSVDPKNSPSPSPSGVGEKLNVKA